MNSEESRKIPLQRGLSTLTRTFLAISRELWPLGRPQQHQEFREKQKIFLHEGLVRLVRTFWPFPENPPAFEQLTLG